jgi:hypothetical protein
MADGGRERARGRGDVDRLMLVQGWNEVVSTSPCPKAGERGARVASDLSGRVGKIDNVRPVGIGHSSACPSAGSGEDMANRSGIEWTDATWNPVTGYDRASEGCVNCYALALAVWRDPATGCLEWTAGALCRDAVTVGGRASRKVFDLRILRHQVRPMYQIECSETLPSDA